MNDLAVKKESEIVPSQQASILQMITQAASNPDVDVDKFERLLAVRKELELAESTKRWFSNMAECQSKMPSIQKGHENTHTRSFYAALEDINKVITPVYTSFGFALSFDTENSELDHHIKIMCDVMHSEGFSKRYSYDSPIDDIGTGGKTNKTAAHGRSSAISYGRRYLTCLIFNLTVGGEDDDGNAAGGDTRSALEVQNWWVAHMTALRDILPSVLCIKESIACNDLSTAVEAFHELTEDEKMVIWKPAPTKGGILTTQERAVMKSPEWVAIALPGVAKAIAKLDAEA